MITNRVLFIRKYLKTKIENSFKQTQKVFLFVSHFFNFFTKKKSIMQGGMKLIILSL